MTYCLAISTRGGLVFGSDSRTNAGPDMLSSHSKMHIFNAGPDRVFVLLAAGNLATTQSIVGRMRQEIEETGKETLRNLSRMKEAARYVSQLGKEESNSARVATATTGVDTSVSLIFGGQIAGGAPGVYMIYSAGNFISESDETPYLQIGESKYGKPILDRIVTRDTSLEDAARCAIVSMDSTIKSNATVGPPIEVLIYERDSFRTDHHIKLDENDTYLRDIKQAWNEALKCAFSSLPLFHWEQRGGVKLRSVPDNPPISIQS
ncbi:MAG: 20S proteasome subunit A/B [Methylococcales bacterium]